MTARRPRPILREQPEGTEAGKNRASRRRTGSAGSGRAVYRLLNRTVNHVKPPIQPPRIGHRSADRMGRGELFEYYKRIGMLEVYFALFPGGLTREPRSATPSTYPTQKHWLLG